MKDWSRLFLSPGMGHCGGGSATLDTFDFLSAAVNWVEKNSPPESVTATGRVFPAQPSIVSIPPACSTTEQQSEDLPLPCRPCSGTDRRDAIVSTENSPEAAGTTKYPLPLALTSFTSRHFNQRPQPRKSPPLSSSYAAVADGRMDAVESPAPVLNQRSAHAKDAASVGEPPLYFGYVGNEHNGRLPAAPVTVADFGGAVPFSTQSSSIAMRSKRLGICDAGIACPSPLAV